MTKILSLYDAIVRTQVDEDRCTNFLLWLLHRLPTSVLLEICEMSGLSLGRIEEDFDFDVQYPLERSRADGLIRLFDGQILIIETKRQPNAFDSNQFLNHMEGGRKEFGVENVWFLFLSGDERIPEELKNLVAQYCGRVGFVSWQSALRLLEEVKETVGERYQIAVEEFLTFAHRYRLGRVIAMTDEELRRFMEVYPGVAKYEEAVAGRYYELLCQARDRIVVESEERVEVNAKGTYDGLPCLYICFTIADWHTDFSAYIFLDVVHQKVGVVLTGYEDADRGQRAEFLLSWDRDWKSRYKDDQRLCSVTWVNQGDDEYAYHNGYFKPIEGTSGKQFKPFKVPAFADNFFWGYVYDFNIDDTLTYADQIAEDFRTLLQVFVGA